MFETTFRNLDDTLRKDAGCSSELDYIEQTSWVLFLKYLDDFEADREASAQLNGERTNAFLATNTHGRLGLCQRQQTASWTTTQHLRAKT